MLNNYELLDLATVVLVASALTFGIYRALSVWGSYRDARADLGVYIVFGGFVPYIFGQLAFGISFTVALVAAALGVVIGLIAAASEDALRHHRKKRPVAPP